MLYKSRWLAGCICIILALGLSAGVSSFNYFPELIIEGEGPQSMVSKELRTRDLDVYTADFDGDRFGDLATLAPSYTVSSLSGVLPNAGSVNIQYGISTGLGTKRNQQLLLDGQYLQANAFFGASAATGDADGDGFTEIVIGSPGAMYGQDPKAGVLSLYRRRSTAMLELVKIIGGDRPDLFLGSSTALGDFDGDGDFDLASGAIGYKVNGKLNAGGVYTYKAPNYEFDRRWTLASAGIKGSPKAQDFFGTSLFSADINNDSYYDLFIGSGVGDGGKGFVNVLYGSPNGLKSAGNQLVRLNNGLSSDNFGWNLTACYCNNDRFADAVFTAPGLQNKKGAAFLIDGTAKGLSSSGSAFLQSPWAEEGDRFGYSIGAIGVEGMNTLAFGSPDATFNGIQKSGRVDLFQYDYPNFKWTPLPFGTRNVDGRKFGNDVNFTANLKTGTYFINAGAPGATINGKADAGFSLSGRVDYQLGGAIRISNRKLFHFDKLAGTNQDNATFGDGFAVHPLIRD